MRNQTFGSESAPFVLIQPVHDLLPIENEIEAIRELTDEEFSLVTVQVEDWNRDLSPWSTPAVFGDAAFGDGASGFLEKVLNLCDDCSKTYVLGGYSLAGLFALWTAGQTDMFSGIAAASPSVWFPGFLDYMRDHPMKSRAVYLSLGDREERTRNPVMSRVGSCIRQGCALLQEQGIRSTLEWNPGNHFRDTDLRTAKAFAWVLNQLA